MDQMYMNPLVEMGVELTKLAVKGTASTVGKKLQVAKSIRDVEELRITYDALINEVVQEREEAVRIAQAYRSELDRIIINDEDIQHLHATISRILDLVNHFSLNVPIESLDIIKELINPDTLKTMQLLGFNYKAAIGEPLTALCAEAISSLGGKNKKKNSNSNQQHKKN